MRGRGQFHDLLQMSPSRLWERTPSELRLMRQCLSERFRTWSESALEVSFSSEKVVWRMGSARRPRPVRSPAPSEAGLSLQRKRQTAWSRVRLPNTQSGQKERLAGRRRLNASVRGSTARQTAQ